MLLSARRLVLIVVLGFGLLVLGVGGGVAEATTGYAFSSSFAPSGGFGYPVGVGVDESDGGVFVADQGDSLLRRFSLTGVEETTPFLPAPAAGANQLTADNYAGAYQGEVFVASYTGGTVSTFNDEGEPLAPVISGLEGPTDVAVDGNGFLYVAQDAGTVLRFNEKGEPVNTAGTPCGACSGHENVVVSESGPIQALAVSSAGNIYLATETGTSEYVLKGTTYEQSTVFQTGYSSGVALGASGEVFVDQGGKVGEYEASGKLLREFGSGRLSGSTYGVAVHGMNVYVADLGDDVVQVFKEENSPQTPLAEPVVVNGSSAVLHGTLEPAGTELTYYFSYNTGGASCTGAGSRQTAPATGQGAVSQTVSVLSQTAYTVCLISENEIGASAPSTPVTFKTPASPPIVEGESVGSITPTEASFSAQVDPESPATICEFQYVDQESFGHTGYTGASTIPCSTLVEGNPTQPPFLEGFDTQPVLASVTGLAPGTTYHYRVLTVSSTGEETTGADETFMTPEAPLTETAIAQSSTIVSLSGELNPNGATGKVTYQFDYNTNGTCTVPKITSQEEKEGKQPPFQPSTRATEVTEGKHVHVQAEATGLEPNEQYTFCLVATNAYGGQAAGNTISTTTGHQAPGITEASVTNITSNAATVDAKINPYGESSAYQIEYGTSAAYGSSTPEVNTGAQHVPLSVQAQLAGLTPATEYHYRITATSGAGTEYTPDATFTTSQTPAEGIVGLPDKRAYEMVTPVENEDADVYVPEAIEHYGTPGEMGIATSLPFQASIDGNAVAYVADPTTGGTGESGSGSGNEYLATRSTTGGWTQTNLQPQGNESAFYQAFSSELSVGIIQSRSSNENASENERQKSLSQEAPSGGYEDLYTHKMSETGYSPFITDSTVFHSSPEEFDIGSSRFPKSNPAAGGIVPYAGASENFSDLFFEANDALTEGAIDGGESENNLYESVGGKLSLVNVLPDGQTEPNATFGAPPTKQPWDNLPDFSHVISASGSRVFWTDLNTNDLYMSENVGSPAERTAQVDARQGGAGPGGGGRFWTADKTGSVMFFTDADSAGLTPDTQPGSGDNLYEYEAPTDQDPDGHLTDLTPVSDAGVEGVIGASEETGEYVYFVATGVLTGSEENSVGRIAQAGRPNVYVLRQGESPQFITTLSSSPAAIASNQAVSSDDSEAIPGINNGGSYAEVGDWQPGLGTRTAEVTPDGHSVVFMSTERLTGYDNEVEAIDRGRRVALSEVFIYNTENRRLTCVSCASNSEPPRVGKPAGVVEGVGSVGVGAFLQPSWSATYLPEWVSADGSRVFFDTTVGLVPQDTNDALDVYEWERDGSGSCDESPGCVYLLSGGVSPSASYFESASSSGNDVFIATRAKLAQEDDNETYDLYDVRADAVPPVSPPACTGTGCQGVPAAPPVFATPPSVTFSGVGNFLPSSTVTKSTVKKKVLTRAQKLAQALKACKAESEKQRAACKKRARGRYGAKTKAKARKSSHVSVKGERS